MRNPVKFWGSMVIAVIGVCFGIADIAFAEANAKGCTTRLYMPDVGPMGILCGKTTCPDPACTAVHLGGTTWVCGCPSNPGSAPFQYLVNSAGNCATFIEYYGSGSFAVTCVASYCPAGCVQVEIELEGGDAVDCDCP